MLAEEIGIHRTYVDDVERGLRTLGLLKIDRMARALETDLPGLMTEVRPSIANWLSSRGVRPRRRNGVDF
jgi:hypothetical protein